MTSSKNSASIKSYSFKAMGSPCEIRLFSDSDKNTDALFDKLSQNIQQLESKYSRFIKDNFLYKVNQAGLTGKSYPVDNEFIQLLEYANTCYQQSDGLFDITSSPLQKLWSKSVRKQHNFALPSEEETQTAKDRMGWQYIHWDNSTLYFDKIGMELDFGGIVKEYAADRAASICISENCHSGIIDLGGDIHIIGPHPNGEPWRIDIRHPQGNEPEDSMGGFSINHGGLASSGSYERFVELEGQRYCHLVSPKTGRPIESMAAVSVVADQCVIAGSVCTIAMLKDKEGPEWLKSVGVQHYMWMDNNGRFGRGEG